VLAADMQVADMWAEQDVATSAEQDADIRVAALRTVIVVERAADSAVEAEAASMVEAAATAVVDTANRPRFTRLTAED
jgi:hypothetical protein